MKIILLIAFLFFNANCQKQEVRKTDKCEDLLLKENLIKSIIDVEELQQYYNVQPVVNQENLVIMKNSQVSFTTDIKKFELPVLVMDSTSILDENIKAFLEFEKFAIIDDSAYVKGKYRIQGLGFEFTFVRDYCNWVKNNIHIWEN